MRDNLLCGVEQFPYNIQLDEFNFDFSTKKSKKTLGNIFGWSLANGTDLTNGVSTNEILDFMFKIQILQYAFENNFMWL